jgi:hypothetical protein
MYILRIFYKVRSPHFFKKKVILFTHSGFFKELQKLPHSNREIKVND